jgi:hypothetical protein
MQITANDTGERAAEAASSGYDRRVISERKRKPVEKDFKSVSGGSRRVERPVTSPDITSDCDVVRSSKASSRCLSGRQRELVSKYQAQA